MSSPFTGEGHALKGGQARSLEFPVIVAGVKLAQFDGLVRAGCTGRCTSCSKQPHISCVS